MAANNNNNNNNGNGANKPFDFDGNRKDARRWLDLTENFIRLNPDSYNTDERKIRFATSYMTKGSAGIFGSNILDIQNARLDAQPVQARKISERHSSLRITLQMHLKTCRTTSKTRTPEPTTLFIISSD